MSKKRGPLRSALKRPCCAVITATCPGTEMLVLFAPGLKKFGWFRTFDAAAMYSRANRSVR
jgi:hypothetical protein